jgi:CRISPR-associated endoribonuclease Cas6
MRIEIELSALDGKIPVNYNEYLQAALYQTFSREVSVFLHNYGFKYQKRTFKLFVFSDLIGSFKRECNYIRFEDSIKLYFSTPINQLMHDFANQIIKKTTIRIFNNELKLSSLKFLKRPNFKPVNKIIMLSPLTVYSTLYSLTGKKKTYYYSPFEKEFSDLIHENLLKKHRLLGKNEKVGSITITPLYKPMLVTRYFKNFIIKGWKGTFTITGNPELIETGYDCGLGSKNSMGFGMFELID